MRSSSSNWRQSQQCPRHLLQRLQLSRRAQLYLRQLLLTMPFHLPPLCPAAAFLEGEMAASDARARSCCHEPSHLERERERDSTCHRTHHFIDRDLVDRIRAQFAQRPHSQLHCTYTSTLTPPPPSQGPAPPLPPPLPAPAARAPATTGRAPARGWHPACWQRCAAARHRCAWTRGRTCPGCP